MVILVGSDAGTLFLSFVIVAASLFESSCISQLGLMYSSQLIVLLCT